MNDDNSMNVVQTHQERQQQHQQSQPRLDQLESRNGFSSTPPISNATIINGAAPSAFSRPIDLTDTPPVNGSSFLQQQQQQQQQRFQPADQFIPPQQSQFSHRFNQPPQHVDPFQPTSRYSAQQQLPHLQTQYTHPHPTHPGPFSTSSVTSSYFSPTSSSRLAPHTNEPSSVSSSYNTNSSPRSPTAARSFEGSSSIPKPSGMRMSLLTSKLDEQSQQQQQQQQQSQGQLSTTPTQQPHQQVSLPHPSESRRSSSVSYSSDPRLFSTSNGSYHNSFQHHFFPHPSSTTTNLNTAIAPEPSLSSSSSSANNTASSFHRYYQYQPTNQPPLPPLPQEPQPQPQSPQISMPTPQPSSSNNTAQAIGSAVHLDISSHPVPDVLVMLTALLQKIIDSNDALQPHGGGANGGGYTPPPEAMLTNDKQFNANVLSFHGRNIPAISLHAYLSRILKYCPTTNEVFISLLVYFDRIAQRANQGEKPVDSSSSLGGSPNQLFVMDSYNIHRLIIAGVTVASKFFSDVFYKNSRYAKVGGLPVEELNHLELQFLLLTDFRLMITLEEMQRYADLLLRFWQKEQQQQQQ